MGSPYRGSSVIDVEKLLAVAAKLSARVAPKGPATIEKAPGTTFILARETLAVVPVVNVGS